MFTQRNHLVEDLLSSCVNVHPCDITLRKDIAADDKHVTIGLFSFVGCNVRCDMTALLFFLALTLMFLIPPPIAVQSDALADGTWLAALYVATNGQGWKSACRTGWSVASANSVCSAGWSGVQCNASDSSGVVTSVNLGDCSLQGGPLPDIPSLLSGQVGTALQYCSTMFLFSNNLTGTIPSSFSSLTSMQHLYLHYNKLTGTLPSSISGLSSLQRLYLHYNSLTGGLPPALSSLSSLQYLYLFANSFSGSLPSSFSSMSSLQDLQLYSNRLTGTIPSSLSSLSSLQQLQLYSNSLTGTIPSSFSSLASLSTLYLHYNSLTGTLPSSFASLSSLKQLYVFSNSLTGTIPSSFGNMSLLQYLYLFMNSLSGTLPSSFGSLSSLQYLALSSNSLTGTLPSSWYVLPSIPTGYDVTSNYLMGDIPSSWLWPNATIGGSYFIGNCLNVTNVSAVTATNRFVAVEGTPRSNASVCAAVAASQGSRTTASAAKSASHSSTNSGGTHESTKSWTASISRSVSVSSSTSMSTSSASSMSTSATASVSTSLSVSRSASLPRLKSTSMLETVSLSSSSVVSTSVTALPTMVSVASGTTMTPLTASVVFLPLSSDGGLSSVTSSVSWSGCQETAVCQVQPAPMTMVCQGVQGECTVMGPATSNNSLLPLLLSSSPFAQISREALDRTTAFGSLAMLVQCIRPRFLRLMNRSTATLNVLTMAVSTSSSSVSGPVFVQLSLQSGDWQRWAPQPPRSPYKAFTLEFPIAAECADRVVNVTLVVLVTPRSLPQLAVGKVVQTTDRVAMWLGAIGGGAFGAGGPCRVAAVRTLLLCSREGASTGGLLALSLERASDDEEDRLLLANARGAIVGNTLVLATWLLVVLALAGAHYVWVSLPAAVASPGLVACARVALPSSLLPVCSAFLP